jgi:subtilisin family serine protease
MRSITFERFLPLSGVLAAVAFATAMFVINPPDVTDGSRELFDYMADHRTAAGVAGFASGYFCLFMLTFSAGLRAALRSGEAGESSYSTVAFAGGVVVAASIGAMGVLELAASEAAHNGEAAVVTAVGYAGDYSWLPWTAGSAAMLIATGLGGLRTLALPRWLAIVTLILGVLCLSGIGGIPVFLVTPLWLLVTAVALHRRQAAPASGRVPVAASPTTA